MGITHEAWCDDEKVKPLAVVYFTLEIREHEGVVVPPLSLSGLMDKIYHAEVMGGCSPDYADQAWQLIKADEDISSGLASDLNHGIGIVAAGNLAGWAWRGFAAKVCAAYQVGVAVEWLPRMIESQVPKVRSWAPEWIVEHRDDLHYTLAERLLELEVVGGLVPKLPGGGTAIELKNEVAALSALGMMIKLPAEVLTYVLPIFAGSAVAGARTWAINWILGHRGRWDIKLAKRLLDVDFVRKLVYGTAPDLEDALGALAVLRSVDAPSDEVNRLVVEACIEACGSGKCPRAAESAKSAVKSMKVVTGGVPGLVEWLEKDMQVFKLLRYHPGLFCDLFQTTGASVTGNNPKQRADALLTCAQVAPQRQDEGAWGVLSMLVLEAQQPMRMNAGDAEWIALKLWKIVSAMFGTMDSVIVVDAMKFVVDAVGKAPYVPGHPTDVDFGYEWWMVALVELQTAPLDMATPTATAALKAFVGKGHPKSRKLVFDVAEAALGALTRAAPTMEGDLVCETRGLAKQAIKKVNGLKGKGGRGRQVCAEFGVPYDSGAPCPADSARAQTPTTAFNIGSFARVTRSYGDPGPLMYASSSWSLAVTSISFAFMKLLTRTVSHTSILAGPRPSDSSSTGHPNGLCAISRAQSASSSGTTAPCLVVYRRCAASQASPWTRQPARARPRQPPRRGNKPPARAALTLIFSRSPAPRSQPVRPLARRPRVWERPHPHRRRARLVRNRVPCARARRSAPAARQTAQTAHRSIRRARSPNPAPPRLAPPSSARSDPYAPRPAAPAPRAPPLARRARPRTVGHRVR